MTHALIVQASSLIQSGDIVRAEALLTALVETDGDHALVEVLDDMPAKDLLAVIREYDTSKQSILSLLITPEQFARAVVMDRLYGDSTHEHLRGMFNSVIFREDADSSEFINAIAELEFGYEAIADYLSDRAEEIVGVFDALDTEELSRAEISDHDWKELTWLLRNEHADIYNIVLKLLKAQIEQRVAAEAVAEQDEDEEDDDVPQDVIVKEAAVDKDDKADDEDSAI
jgi:hypothetical protein